MTLSLAIISREYPPFFGGGIGTYTEQFSKAMAAAGHRVAVLTVSDSGQETREQRDGVTVVRFPFLQGQDWSGPHPSIADPRTRAAFHSFSPVSVLAMQVARALPRLADEFDLDAVEAPDTGALSWFALNDRRLGRPCGRRGWPAFITHLHSPTAWIERWDRALLPGRPHAELKRMERDVVRWADGVICPSRGLADWSETHFGLQRGAVEVLRYPLGDLELPEPRRERQQTIGRRVVYAGRIEPRKGVDILLAGFSMAVDRGANLRLDLAGRDIDDPRTGRPFGMTCLERLVSPAARERIAVHGPIQPKALATMRRAADFAAAPAPNDNFPYTCMEAMAAGLPVIAARAGGMAEMISGNGDGILFEPGDVEGCAAALERAARLSASELSAMESAAQARIGSLCATAAVVRDRTRHFEEVIQRARGTERPRRNVEVVVIGSGESGPLVDAVRAGAAFAHGWARIGDSVQVFGTPSLEGLALAPRGIGPIAAARSVLENAPENTNWRSPWDVAAALARCGNEGAVVPDCLNDAPNSESAMLWPHAVGTDAVDLCLSLGPAMVAAIAAARNSDATPTTGAGNVDWRIRAKKAETELARIKSSRGWRWLNRVYAVLHILKGRGRPSGGAA